MRVQRRRTTSSVRKLPENLVAIAATKFTRRGVRQTHRMKQSFVVPGILGLAGRPWQLLYVPPRFRGAPILCFSPILHDIDTLVIDGNGCSDPLLPQRLDVLPEF